MSKKVQPRTASENVDKSREESVAEPSSSSSGPSSSQSRPSSSRSSKSVARPSSSQSSKRADIRSENFDPLAALYAEDQDKCEGLVFQSVSQCESYFSRKDKREKKVDEEKVDALPKDETLLPGEGRMVPMEAMPERRMSAILKDPSSSVTMPSRPRRPLRNVLTRMDEVEEGPLSLLRRAVKDGIRVRVWTRSHVYIRGICSGFLVAYDKHVNLAMTDVDEEFLIPKSTRDAEHERMRKRKRRRRLKEEAEKRDEEEEEVEENEENHNDAAPEMGKWRVNEVAQIPSSQGKRTFTFGQVQKRHIGQLFIKGDNVVIVSLAVT